MSTNYKHSFDRRSFLATSAGALLTCSLYPQRTALAIGPLCIVAGRVLLRSAFRSVLRGGRSNRYRNLGRSGASHAERRTGRDRMRELTSKGVNGGGIISINPSIHALALEINAKAIWVSGDENVRNEFSISGRNESSQVIDENLLVGFHNIDTGRLIVYSDFSLRVLPKIDFSIDLNGPIELARGAYRILAALESSRDVYFAQSPNLVVAGAGDLELSD
jgi:hypothetical protein